MDEHTQEIRLVKDDRQIAIDLVTSVIGLAIMYYVLNPNALDDVQAWVRKQVNALAHKLSIWSAQKAIQSLPETES